MTKSRTARYVTQAEKLCLPLNSSDLIVSPMTDKMEPTDLTAESGWEEIEFGESLD